MRQQKKAREVKYCRIHTGEQMKKRRGPQSHKWIWECAVCQAQKVMSVATRT